MLTDPIADMLTRLRNGQRVKKSTVTIPHSKMKESIVKVLLEEGYIFNYVVNTNEKTHPELEVALKYYEGKPVITEVKRRSKPGRRVYSAIKDLSFVANGLGINILSTSKGVMSDAKARSMSLGGEVICTVF